MINLGQATAVAITTASLAMSLGVAACSSQRGNAEQDSQTMTQADDEKGKDMPDDKGGSNTKGDAAATGIETYVVKVGYRSTDDGGTRIIAGSQAWSDYVDYMADTYYDGLGNEVSERNKDFKDYPESFFENGGKIAVAYSSLPSGACSPTITDTKLEKGTLTVTYDTGVGDDVVTTTDMSGFVVVAEVPEGTSITQVKAVQTE